MKTKCRGRRRIRPFCMCCRVETEGRLTRGRKNRCYLSFSFFLPSRSRLYSALHTNFSSASSWSFRRSSFFKFPFHPPISTSDATLASLRTHHSKKKSFSWLPAFSSILNAFLSSGRLWLSNLCLLGLLFFSTFLFTLPLYRESTIYSKL